MSEYIGSRRSIFKMTRRAEIDRFHLFSSKSNTGAVAICRRLASRRSVNFDTSNLCAVLILLTVSSFITFKAFLLYQTLTLLSISSYHNQNARHQTMYGFTLFVKKIALSRPSQPSQPSQPDSKSQPSKAQ